MSVYNGELSNNRKLNNNIPDKFELLQNYPNPFNPVTSIEYRFQKSSFVQLQIFDVMGNLIKNLFEGYLNAGEYKVTWDAGNYPSGTYFYKITAPEFSTTKKMVLIK
jgi:hypothetical protein